MEQLTKGDQEEFDRLRKEIDRKMGKARTTRRILKALRKRVFGHG